MTFVLLHGAASDSWYWHLVVPELEAGGHEVLAPDLPADDDGAGFVEYADTVVAAAEGHADLVLVAQSLAGFTAPLVADRLPVQLLVLVAAMVPAPGEPPGAWWEASGWGDARRELLEREGRPPEGMDVLWDFFHDVPDDVVAAAMARGERDQSGTPFERPYPFTGWPDVPTRYLLGRDDRFFPADFLRRIVPERLGIVPDEMAGGHLPALAHPRALAQRLLAYADQVG